MKFFICVYLHPILTNGGSKSPRREVSGNKALKEYLQRYENSYKKNKGGIGRFYDWGDDPAFFAAEYFSKDINKATWGVCRPDVRKKLCEGDVVVFFCAQQQRDETTWKYYYIGLGTVGEVVQPREKIWKMQRYAEYRKFFNLIINSMSCHSETINPHKDWAHRLASPYIVFDNDPERTHFNVTNPLLVAIYSESDIARKGKTLEHWMLEDERVNTIYKLVGKRDSGSRLRIPNKYHPHKEMNLVRLDDKQLERKRREFLKVSKTVAKSRRS